MLKRGGSIHSELLETVLPEKDYEEVERRWIKDYKDTGCPLTNQTIGGEGSRGLRFNHTKEAKDKITMNNGRGMLGKHHTEEANKKNSDAHIGKPSPRKGGHWTESQRILYTQVRTGKSSPLKGRPNGRKGKPNGRKGIPSGRKGKSNRTKGKPNGRKGEPSPLKGTQWSVERRKRHEDKKANRCP